jgi:hypothetical protein
MTGRAVVRYALPAPSDAVVQMFDALGRVVWSHQATAQQAGGHAVELNVESLAAGVYVLRVEAGGASVARRVSVVR